MVDRFLLSGWSSLTTWIDERNNREVIFGKSSLSLLPCNWYVTGCPLIEITDTWVIKRHFLRCNCWNNGLKQLSANGEVEDKETCHINDAKESQLESFVLFGCPKDAFLKNNTSSILAGF